MAIQTRAKLIKNIEVAKKYYKISLLCPAIARMAKPGQFVQAKIIAGFEPLLRRPFSIHKAIGSQIDILYEVIGEGTRLLSQRKAGELVDVIGPLGNGFDYPTPNTKHQTPILVAGGMGVAPLVFLAQRLAASRPVVLIGARNKSSLLCEKEFAGFGCKVKVSTNDGSKGFKGRVTELLKSLLLTTYSLQLTTIYACGPKPMLKEVSLISKDYGIPSQVSLEEHMSCGIGACLGCVVNTHSGYRRVCKEGPVFASQEIAW